MYYEQYFANRLLGQSRLSGHTLQCILPSGAGSTLLIALVGTFVGCLIGFGSASQTIPVSKQDSIIKRALGCLS